MSAAVHGNMHRRHRSVQTVQYRLQQKISPHQTKHYSSFYAGSNEIQPNKENYTHPSPRSSRRTRSSSGSLVSCMKDDMVVECLREQGALSRHFLALGQKVPSIFFPSCISLSIDRETRRSKGKCQSVQRKV